MMTYSFEEKLDKAANFLFSTSDTELSKLNPKLVKAKNVILAENDVELKACEDAIKTFETVIFADRLYDEKAAAKLVVKESGNELKYNFKPLLEVMQKDAVALGLEDGLKLHEIYDKVLENKNTQLNRLLTEIAPYKKILSSAKSGKEEVVMKGVAERIYDFEIEVRRIDRENVRRITIPIQVTPIILFIGHRLSPPIIPESISIDMRIKRLT